jgi:dTDP-4-amino-4,6-dideoxygalactose transaminase
MNVRQTPASNTTPSVLTVEQLEATLEEWFGSPVVLTSSGRAAMALALDDMGLNRYRHRVALPRMISACVVGTVIRHGFPVDAAGAPPADAAILYHQYGFPQVARPDGPVLEDICHAFFASPTTGRRTWAGEMAAFSLPKFFSTSGSVGGLVVHDRARAEKLRGRRDSHVPRSPQAIAAEAATFRSHGGEAGLEQMYLSRLLNPRIADEELGGLPADTQDIQAIGRRRGDILAAYLSAVPEEHLAPAWRDLVRRCLPYFFPVQGNEARLGAVKQSLVEAGVEADIYTIDTARSMAAPKAERMLLVPCHHTIAADMQDVITGILGRHLRGAP